MELDGGHSIGTKSTTNTRRRTYERKKIDQSDLSVVVTIIVFVQTKGDYQPTSFCFWMSTVR